ncbi:MAG: glycosyltransferase [Clostridiales bacterium]|nr:glycosyltransferase [Clostridiales bacterium]
MNKLYAYLPCYNESGNIQALIEGWLNEKETLLNKGFDLEIIPIDDKSTDNTLQIIQSMEKTYDTVRVIAHKTNQNLGGALFTAIRDFLHNAESDDLMCFMDGDNTHKPQFVHSMISKSKEGAECVIASRYQPGATINGVPSNRLLLSDGAKLYYSMILRVPDVKDYTCGYRLYTYSILRRAYGKYKENLVTMHSFSCMMELLYKLHKSGCKFAEVPFTLYYDNKVGASKMRILRTVKDSLFVALDLRLHCK